MNKQQLAAKIWESANKMRSKIEANEYKDYILGLFFISIFLKKRKSGYMKLIIRMRISSSTLMRKMGIWCITHTQNLDISYHMKIYFLPG